MSFKEIVVAELIKDPRGEGLLAFAIDILPCSDLLFGRCRVGKSSLVVGSVLKQRNHFPLH